MKYVHEMQRKKYWFLLWVLPAGIACAIFFFSSQDGNESSALSNSLILFLVHHLRPLIPFRNELTDQEFLALLSPFIRKGAHVTEHLILYLSLFPAMKASRFRFVPPKALLVTFLNACSDEIHQLFVSGRHGCFTDVLIDCSAAAVFTLLLILLKYHQEKSHNA